MALVVRIFFPLPYLTLIVYTREVFNQHIVWYRVNISIKRYCPAQDQSLCYLLHRFKVLEPLTASLLALSRTRCSPTSNSYLKKKYLNITLTIWKICGYTIGKESPSFYQRCQNADEILTKST